MPIIPATPWDAEAGESLEPRRWRLQLAKIMPLHSSLGDKGRLCLKKKSYFRVVLVRFGILKRKKKNPRNSKSKITNPTHSMHKSINF